MADDPRRERVGRERAEQAVATRFSRLMNASTSPLGVFSDPALAGLPTACFLVVLLAALSRDPEPRTATVLGALSVAPLLVALLASLALRGARGRVLSWLAGLPFPLENVNALLNGVGTELEIHFEAESGAADSPAPSWPPSREELNTAFDAVSPDVFVTTIHEDDRALDVRIGVVDSKLNPARSNHQRYARVRAICDQALTPMSATRRIASVRVK